MKILKILFTIVFTLVIIMVVGLAFLVYTFDANQYKTKIVDTVKKQTGRDLVIDGDLKLSVFPDIAIELGKTSLSNAKGFSDKQFADIGSGEISVKVMPLLQKQVKLDEIRLQDLKLNLQRKADGTTNWNDLVKKEEQAEDDKKPNKVVQEMVDNLSIAGVSLQNAHIRWRDQQAGQDLTFSPVNLKTGVFKPNSPLSIELELTMKQQQPAMTLTAKGNTTVTLTEDGDDQYSFRLAALNLDSTITGEPVANGRLHAILQGDVTGNSQRIAVNNLTMKTQLEDVFFTKSKANTTLKSPFVFDLNTQTLSMPTLSVQAQLTGALVPEGKAFVNLQSGLYYDVKKQILSLTDVSVTSDVDGQLLEGGKLQAVIHSKETQFNLASQQLNSAGLTVKTDLQGGLLKKGSANAQLSSSNVQFNMAKQQADIKQLTLDAHVNGELLQGAAATIKLASQTMQLNLAKTQLKIPALKLDTTIKGGPVPSGLLTQNAQGSVDLNWGQKTGGITLPSLRLAMADLQLQGSNMRLQPLAAKPSMTGQLQTNTFNLKQVLKMLGIEPPVTAKPTVLTKVQARFNVQADTNKVALNNLQMKLDGSTVSGRFALNDFTQQAMITALTIDRITVDDYLTPANNNKTNTTPTTSKHTSQNQEEELLPLDSLKTLNLDADLKVSNLVLNKLKLSNVRTKIKAKNGLVQLNPANANLYKGRYKGNITIDARQATPSLTMHHELIKLRSENLLFDLFAERYLSGSAQLITDLSSRGNTLTRVLQNLNGKTTMGFKDGHIRDSKLAEQVALAVKLFEKKEIQGDKTVVTFTGLSGDWQTKQGVFNTNNLKLLSPYFTIKGTGQADVANQELDMKVRISQAGNEKIFAPLRIYGSFSEPKFKLDLQELVKSLAQEELEKVKQDAKERLKQAEREAKEQLKQRLEAEKIAREQQLKDKLAEEKQRAIDKLKEQVGEKATEEIEKQLKDNVEEQIKDKLKDSLRGLF